MNMTANKKGPIVDPGLCRCCGNIKKCRLLNFEYESLGKREVYSEMFVDCFGLLLSNLDGEELKRLICATCVVRLRDASAFRHQVLCCEEQLLKATVHIHDASEDHIKIKVEVKQEVIETPEEMNDGGDDAEMNDAGNDAEMNDVSVDDRNADDLVEPAEKEDKVPIKIPREEQTPIQSIDKSKPRSRRRCKDGSTMQLDTSLKADMLKKLQRMKDKLNKKSISPPKPTKPSEPAPKIKRAIIQDKDINTIRNAQTIIENSYVTPFIAMFSDYYCVYCREMFTEPDKLREHTLEHDPRTYQEHQEYSIKKMVFVDIMRIDCRLCQTQINDIDTFKEHVTRVHKKIIFKNVDTEFIKFKLTMGKLSCIECDKTFNFFQALKKHMAEHFGTYICDVCGAHYFQERDLIFHKKTHNADRNVEMFPCNECEKTFRSKNSRTFHIARIHKNEAAYPCNKCDEVFISYHMRYRHKITAHGEKREFPCEGCDKIYDCRKTLREHYQRTHLQLLRHECKVCDKKFYLPSALRDHMTSHTGERLYRCDYCGKNYPRKKALKVHMQSHNTEKKYKCNLCPSSYTQANNFKNHMKSKHPMCLEYNQEY